MTAPDPAPEAGWTIETLRQWTVDRFAENARLIEILSGERARFLDERSTRIDERFDAERAATDAAITALDKQITSALAAQERALSAALAAQERASTILESQSKEWRSAANEWRGAMTDRDRLLVSRDTYDTATGAITRQLNDLSTRLTLAEGKAAGVASFTSLILSVAAVIATIVMAAIAILAFNG